MSETSFIPFHRPSIGVEESEAVLQVLRSQWLTTGPIALAFQEEFASYIGCKHALAVNSGTAALQLALDAVGLQRGDEVLVPTNTFTATAEVVTYFGARPVLCDVVPGGFNLDPHDAERQVTQRTRAIIPVHVGGEPCAMTELQAIAARHKLAVVEDAAHALPAVYRGARIGKLSDLTAFSFYATKTITTGEGGMLTTNNDEYAKRASVMRLHGIAADAWKRYSRAGHWYYEVTDAGYKLNLPDLLAAVGRVQLRKCDEFWEKRRRIREFYDLHFGAMEELQIPPAPDPGVQHSWHLYILRIVPTALGIHRNEFIDELKQSGIGTSVHFIPLHRHPYYKKEYGYQPPAFPNAEDAFSRSISLPIFPDMTLEEMERVVLAVKHTVATNLKRTCVAVTKPTPSKSDVRSA